jgi:hypothetical protein
MKSAEMPAYAPVRSAWTGYAPITTLPIHNRSKEIKMPDPTPVDKASITIKKMDDGTIDVLVISARSSAGAAPAAIVNMPADVFAIMIRECADGVFSSFDWTAD